MFGVQILLLRRSRQQTMSRWHNAHKSALVSIFLLLTMLHRDMCLSPSEDYQNMSKGSAERNLCGGFSFVFLFYKKKKKGKNLCSCPYLE
jgi:hypothetical protein